MICYHCRAEIKIRGFISRTDECPKCASDVHCCLNCGNYDPAAHNRCREPQAEWVSDREKANFCDYFIPNMLKADAVGKPGPSDAARRAFQDLFKK
jgi:hypothetical protein